MPQYESQFEEKLYNERRDKLARIAALGQKAGLTPAEAIYPNHFRFSPEDIDVPTIKRQYESATTEQLETGKPPLAIAGRLIAIRLQGKAGFAQLQQGGQSLQLYVRKDIVGDDAFELYKLLDLGDHIGVEGVLFRTRTNELTLQVQKLAFLAKAMLALPDKYHGLEDVELRYRQRYVDLIVNSGNTAKSDPLSPSAVIPSDTKNETVILSGARSAESKDPDAANPTATADTFSTTEPTLNVREVFVKRAAILRAIRKFFDARGYLEVETPMLQTIAGGAAARPFTTHHNALAIPLSLRIAPELYLKRLVVGGFDRVYEINRNFRNEGVSTQHNPEFTMLEFYQAYANYHDLMDLTPKLIESIAMEVNGTTLTHFNSEPIELATHNWTKLSMREAIKLKWPTDETPMPEVAFEESDVFAAVLAVLAKAERRKASEIAHRHTNEYRQFQAVDESTYEKQAFHQMCAHELDRIAHAAKAGEISLGTAIAKAFENLWERDLIQPTIIYDFPLAVSPLSKVKPDEPAWVERFEFYIGGFEVGNAFSELNDPDDQLRRFEAQLEDRKRGDEEAMAAVDEDYIRALGYGLPPTAGEGIGIDRLTMILTGSRSIRDVILFPLMRPHKTATPDDAQPNAEPAE